MKKLPKEYVHVNLDSNIEILAGTDLNYLIICFALISKIILFFTKISFTFVFSFNGKKYFVNKYGSLNYV